MYHGDDESSNFLEVQSINHNLQAKLRIRHQQRVTKTMGNLHAHAQTTQFKHGEA